MIDFFTALLEPRFSESSPLQPRVPALFEPVAPRAEVGGSSDWAQANEDEMTRAPGRANTRRPGPALPPEGGQERAPYRGAMNVLRDLRITQSPAAPAPPPGPDLRAAHPADSTARETRPAQPIPGARVGERREHARGEQEPRQEGESPEGTIRPAPLPEPPSAERRSGSGLQAAVAPHAAPVVRIEIGRIVVRAVQPGAEHSKPRSPAPAKKLSLDDYLKKHERGER